MSTEFLIRNILLETARRSGSAGRHPANGVYLDRKNHPLGRHLITLGTIDATLVSCREVFRGAILAGARALVVAHNHPSGDPAPSAADINVTRKLREAAKILEIELLDHRRPRRSGSEPTRGLFVSRSGFVPTCTRLSGFRRLNDADPEMCSAHARGADL